MCNSSANPWFGVSTCIAALLFFDFLSKHLWTRERGSLWYSSYCELFGILNALSQNTSARTVLLAKPLKFLEAISCWQHALSSSV